MSISVTGTTTTGSKVKIGKNAMKRDHVNFEDTTDANGRASFVIDTPGNFKSMKIKVGYIDVTNHAIYLISELVFDLKKS